MWLVIFGSGFFSQDVWSLVQRVSKGLKSVVRGHLVLSQIHWAARTTGDYRLCALSPHVRSLRLHLDPTVDSLSLVVSVLHWLLADQSIRQLTLTPTQEEQPLVMSCMDCTTVGCPQLGSLCIRGFRGFRTLAGMPALRSLKEVPATLQQLTLQFCEIDFHLFRTIWQSPGLRCLSDLVLDGIVILDQAHRHPWLLGISGFFPLCDR
jgi:hypothetical protein